MSIKGEIEIGGVPLSIEFKKVAKQANGSAWVQYGETVVLVTASRKKEIREGIDFLPLLVDYRENTYAAGRFPGGFFKREGKPSEREILVSRLIDRPLRPLFPEGYYYDTQIVASVFSYDMENDPDVLGITGASLALYLSDIPFEHPVAGVRVGLIDGKFVINPKNSELKNSKLNLVVAGTEDAIVMVESLAYEVDESTMIDALEFAHEHIKKIVGLQKELYEKVKPEKLKFENPFAYSNEIYDEIKEKYYERIKEAIYIRGKLEREEKIETIVNEILENVEDEEQKILYKTAFHDVKKDIFRHEVLVERKRPDGRGFKEIRPISIEVGILPRTHGSALFTRGETQALVSATLGTFEDVQIIDTIVDEEEAKRFMVHYNFPPFSVGEVSPLRAPSRREIGHGNLAERGLLPAIPSEEEFPYTIRVVSEILESNGSSSMATVCGGCLALMDAGVPLKMPIAGIAMGLIKEGDKYAILTDIAGFEDHYGDMDFKVAGSKNGITALQMDIKIKGVTREIMEEALLQAKEARLFLLDKMLEVIPEPRKTISERAPRIYKMHVNPEKIRDIIGPAGKTIKNIINETGVKINIEPDGLVVIASPDEESQNKAIDMIKNLTDEPEVGKIYKGKITRVEDYGIFVEIMPNVIGLVHVSEISSRPIKTPAMYFSVGDEVEVKVTGIDEFGRVKLSKKLVDGGVLPQPKKNYQPREHHNHHKKPFQKKHGFGRKFPDNHYKKYPYEKKNSHD